MNPQESPRPGAILRPMSTTPAPFDIQVLGRDQVENRKVAARLADKIRRVPGAVDIRVQQRSTPASR